MNTKTIEVELRGPLSESEYQNLLTLLSEKGTVQKKTKPFFIGLFYLS